MRAVQSLGLAMTFATAAVVLVLLISRLGGFSGLDRLLSHGAVFLPYFTT